MRGHFIKPVDSDRAGWGTYKAVPERNSEADAASDTATVNTREPAVF